MSLLSAAFWRFFGGSIANPDRGTQRDAPTIRTSETGDTVSEDRALQITSVFAALRILSGIIGSLPIEVLTWDTGAKQWRKAEDHPLYDPLIYTPNPVMTAYDMRRALALQFVFWGNAYAQIIRDGSGKVRELYPLKPPQMALERLDEDVVRYVYTTARGTALLRLDQVLHVRGMSTDGLIGVSAAGYGAQAFGTAVAGERFAARFFRNGGRPSGVLMFDKGLNEDQKAKIRANFAGIADGGSSENGLWVLELGAKYQAIEVSPEDSQLLESRKFMVAEFARLFGIPSILLMDQEKSTSWGSGIEQQILAFYVFTIEPIIKAFEAAFNRWLVPAKEQKTTKIEFNVEGLLRMDSQAKAAFLRDLTQNGIMTRNEARSKLNLPAKPEADDLTVQQQNVPLGTPPAAPAAPATPPMEEEPQDA